MYDMLCYIDDDVHIVTFEYISYIPLHLIL